MRPTILTLSADQSSGSDSLVSIADLLANLATGSTFHLRYFLTVNQEQVAATHQMAVQLDVTDIDWAVGVAADSNSNQRVESGVTQFLTVDTAQENQLMTIDLFVKTAASGSPQIDLTFGIEAASVSHDLTVLAGSVLQINPL